MSDKIEEWLRKAGGERIQVSGGANYSSTCPFCNPGGKWPGKSFAIHVDSGLYVCYRPECGATGHVRRMLVDLLGMSPNDASEATASLEQWRKVELSDIPSWDDRFLDKDVASIDSIHEATIGLYKFTPVYMRERGFSRETLRYWEIGYDLARHRVTFPVRNGQGVLLGFSTRTTDPYEFPKYLHMGFRKGSVLYGESYSQNDRVVVGEGNPDALALHQLLGHKYKAVSTLGSLVSREQIRKLFKYRVVLLSFDKDSPGVAATRSVGDRLEAMGHREVFVIDFLDFPDAKDPAEIVGALGDRETKTPYKVKRYQRWRADESTHAE